MDSFQEQLHLSPDNFPGTTREPGAKTVNWGGAVTPLVCERGRSFYSSSKIMSKEVNKAFDKELGKYNTLLIYNCHCL